MDHQLIHRLNNLLRILNNSKANLEEYASQIKCSQLQLLLYEIAEQRKNLIAAISNSIKFLGGNPIVFHNPSAITHIFLALKNLFFGNDINSIANEIRNSETIILDSYYEVLQREMPKPIKTLLKQHVHEIESALYRIEVSSYAW